MSLRLPPQFHNEGYFSYSYFKIGSNILSLIFVSFHYTKLIHSILEYIIVSCYKILTHREYL